MFLFFFSKYNSEHYYKKKDILNEKGGEMQFFRWGSTLIVFTMIITNAFILNAQYVNPLKGDIGVHDPVLIKEGTTYYVYSTGSRIQFKSSTDRITWKNRNSVLSSTPSWVGTDVPENNGTDFWAPDISFRDSKYWLYYSVSSFGKNTSGIGLATSPTLDPSSGSYKWTDLGMVVKSTSTNDYNCIDPNSFQNTDGTVWLTFGSFWSGIKLVELDPSTGKPQSGAAITSIAARTSNTLGIEAPFITKWNNYYYLFVSWDVCCDGVNSTYKIVVGRASKVTGPYTDKSGKTMTSGGGTILDQGDSRWKGPGHNGILIEKDTVFCINHAYDANSNGDPIMMIRPFYWVDGWPTFTKPIVSANLSMNTGFKTSSTKKPHLVLSANINKLPNVSKVIYSINGERMKTDNIHTQKNGVLFVISEY
jgi:arabinan endo-1,5-alpha-L-arabinosidase